MAEYNQPIDIANRALQLCGAPRISTFQDDSKGASSVNFVYDKLRTAELRRNVWRFSTRRTILRAVSPTTAYFQPQAWSSTATYLFGSIVSYGGITYQAKNSVPANQEPDTSFTYWAPYFGSRTLDYWNAPGVFSSPTPGTWSSGQNYAANDQAVGSDGYVYASLVNGNMGNNPVTDGGVHWLKLAMAPTGEGYYAGEICYVQGQPGVYVSLINSNSFSPTVIPAWVNTQVYQTGQTVVYNSVTYQSAIDFNVGNTPTGTGDWVAQPAAQPDSMVGNAWLYMPNASYSALKINYPAGSGPNNQSATRNVFFLPNGFLREAPQDAKAGSTSWLGAPSGLMYNDWQFEGNLLISREVYSIPFRFVTDFVTVADMDPMFCEGLAARIALEIVEELTQSTGKLNNIGRLYQGFMGEAREVNGIEMGASEPPEDDYVTCRI